MAPSRRDNTSNTSVGSCSNDSTCVSVVLGCLIPILVVASFIPIMLVKRRFDSRRAARILRNTRVRSSVHVRSQIVQVAPHTPRLPVKSVYIARVNYYLPAPPTMESDLCSFPSSESIVPAVPKESDVQLSPPENPYQLDGPSTSLKIQQSEPLISLPSLCSMLGEFSAYADAIDPELPELSGQVRRSSTCILTEANSRLSTMGVLNSRLSMFSQAMSESDSAESSAIPDHSQVLSVEDAVRLMATLEEQDFELGYETELPSVEPALEPAVSANSQNREELLTGIEPLVIEGPKMGDKASIECSLQEEEENHVITQLALIPGDSVNDRTLDTPIGQLSEALEEICTSGTTSRTALIASTTVLSVAIDTTFSLSTLSSVLAVRLDEFPAVPSFMPINLSQNVIRSNLSNAQSAVEGLGETMLRPRHSSITIASFSTSTTSLTRSISAPATLDLMDLEGDIEVFSREAHLPAQLHLSLPLSQYLSTHLAHVFGQSASGVRTCIFSASRSQQNTDGPGDLWDEEDESLFTSFVPPTGKDVPYCTAQKRDLMAQRERYTWTAGMSVGLQGCQAASLISDLSETKGEDEVDTEGDSTGELWDDEDERRFSASSLLQVCGVPQLSASATTDSSIASMTRERRSYRSSLRKSAIATLASLEGSLNLSVSLSHEESLEIGTGKDVGGGRRVSTLDVGSLSVLTSLAVFAEESEGDAWLEEAESDVLHGSGSVAVNVRSDLGATINNDRETLVGVTDSPPSSETAFNHCHISGSVNNGAHWQVACDATVHANTSKECGHRIERSPNSEAYHREPEVNNQGANSSRSLQELLLLLDAGLSSQEGQLDEDLGGQASPFDDGDVTLLCEPWSPEFESPSVSGGGPQRNRLSVLGFSTKLRSLTDRNPDCATLDFASCLQPSKSRETCRITTEEDADHVSLKSTMDDVLENGEPLVDIDVGNIHCAELSFTDPSLASSFSKLAEFGDGIENLFDIEECEVGRWTKDKEIVNLVDVELSVGQDVERELADDVLELLADASLVFNPNHDEALNYKLIETGSMASAICSPTHSTIQNYNNASTKQSGSDAGSFKLELYQWACDHVLEVYADARCGHGPEWKPSSAEQDRALCYTMEFEMKTGQEFTVPASDSNVTHCFISEEVYQEEASRLRNNRSGKVNEKDGGSTRDEMIDYLVSGSGSYSQNHAHQDDSELSHLSETLEKGVGSLADELSFIVKTHELRSSDGSEVSVPPSTSNLDKSSSTDASFDLSVVDDSGYSSCEVDMCSTVKLPRQNESEELLSDISLSEDEVLVHQAISTPCASFETADTFWVHDHSRSSVTYSEDEHLQTTSDMQQLEQLGCEEGDHDDQEKFKSVSNAGVVELLSECSGSQNIFNWSEIDSDDHILDTVPATWRTEPTLDERKPDSLPDSEQPRASDFSAMEYEGDLVAITNSKRSSVCSTTSASTWISCMSLASVLHSDIYSTSDQQRSACPSLSSCFVTHAGEDPGQNSAGKRHEWSTASDTYLRSDIDSDLGEIDMEIEADYSVSSYLRLLTARAPLTLTAQ